MKKLMFSPGRWLNVVFGLRPIFRLIRGHQTAFNLLVLFFGISFAAAQTVPLPNIPSGTFNITSSPYNAVGDGVTTNTTAIQAAINACTAAGGGTILVPRGTFLCGPITLGKSNNLELASGALLRMLPFGSYPSNAPAFITASSLTDVEISGSGSIDGQGGPWLAAFATNGNLARPVMLNVTKCTRVAILGVSFTNAPVMHLTVKNNTSVTLQGATILTTYPSKNTDGMDIAAVGAYIQGDSISDGDDVIAVGSTASFSGNIFVTNCFFGNGHGLSMGSDTAGGISNLTVINCTFNGTQYGLKGKSARDRGGLAHDIGYYNLTLTNIQFPLSYNSYYTNSPAPTDPSQDPGQPITADTPFWQNLIFSNITASAASGFAVGSFWGLPEAPVSNVVMTTVTLNGKTGLQLYHVRAFEFASDCSINVTSGSRMFLYDAQVSSQLATAGALNLAGIATDGAAFGGGGLDGHGNAYSATALGPSVSPGGFLFALGAPGGNNVISAAGQTLAVPAGLQANYQALILLGAGVNGPQSNQVFVVNYTDSSTQAFVQDFSDWGTPQTNAGESVAVTMSYRDAANGSMRSMATYAYQYTFLLDSNKVVSSVTLPNNSNVVILGALASFLPTNTTPTLVAVSNVTVLPRSSSAILSWSASSGAASELLYGPTPALGYVCPVSSSNSPNQSALLIGLQTNTVYYYEIIAASGNNGAISSGTFSTSVSVIMQSSQALYTGVWVNDSSATDRYSPIYKYASTVTGADTAEAVFTPNLPISAQYDTYLWYSEGVNRSSYAPVLATYQGGSFSTTFNETVPGGRWQLVTSNQTFAAGTNAFVRLGNGTGESNKIVIADAVMWVYTSGQDMAANGTLPNWWSEFYLSADDVDSSSPGANGYSLLADYIFGLSPIDPNAAFNFSVRPAQSGLQAFFSPWAGGRIYQVQSTTSLLSPVWTNIPNLTVMQTNGLGMISYTNTSSAPAFYRLSVQMTP